MSLSLTDLPQRVLQRLSVIEIGGSVEADHSALVSSAYQEVYYGLVDEGLIEWSDSEAIPDKRALAMIALTADQVKFDFQVPPDVRQEVGAQAAGAVAFLRRKATNAANRQKSVPFLDY